MFAVVVLTMLRLRGGVPPVHQASTAFLTLRDNLPDARIDRFAADFQYVVRHLSRSMR